MSKGDNLKGDVNIALIEKQDELGLLHAGANLWPGTAAAVAAAVYEPVMWQLVAMIDRLDHGQISFEDMGALSKIKRMLR